jgi:hypothetical protein
MLRNGGMEGTFQNGIAPEWGGNCYGVFPRPDRRPRPGASWSPGEGSDLDGVEAAGAFVKGAAELLLDDAKPAGVVERDGLTIHLFAGGTPRSRVILRMRMHWTGHTSARCSFPRT